MDLRARNGALAVDTTLKISAGGCHEHELKLLMLLLILQASLGRDGICRWIRVVRLALRSILLRLSALDDRIKDAEGK